ncbi:IS630 family transposase [Micromonospora craniellae]|uniref:IS630 family transposase n=1 Tax=Micromonospora craniellae TaxID=2294034 RepID=A0A372FR10_9ACTN|nr:IS630 family transposase [Micromonospora craniellae]QOC93934.1 IS630 family transposase [Micromonospora craniellae]RFS41050.1 IS630 family transposase [Micromonospora craniellae]
MGVVVRDARRLSPAAQEDLRRRAVAAVKAGHTQAAVATVFGVSPKTVWRWINAFDRQGNRALKAGKRGRRPGEQKALDPRQQARVRRAVLHKNPDQVALPGLVWTRPQVRRLIRDWFGIDLSLVTVGKYLRSWGLSPQKPIRRAYEQNPEAVARWLDVKYPAIEAQARKEKAIILWLDQTGLRSDAAVGATWAPVGQTPVVAKTGRRFGVNVMAAISNKGELYFTCYHGSFTGPMFLAWLDRLVRQLGRKIHLIVDGRPVHRRVTVRDWLAERVDRVEMHFLPGYAPELNPVELLNADVKHHVAQANPATPAELSAAAASHLRRRQNQPETVKALFRKPEVRYAAG